MMQQRQQFLMRPPRWLAAMLAASLVGGAAVARAEDATPPAALTLSGFGSLGVAHSNERQADYTSTVLKGSGVGYTHPWSADIDSRLGAQADWRINPQWSAVLQVISEQNRLDSYVPAVEWANLKYEVTPDLSIRAGRVVIPAFLSADYRKVGYALPWVRTPVEVYGTFGSSNSDGVDLSYRWRSGVVKNVTQAMYGSTDIKLSDTSKVPVRNLFVLTNAMDYRAFTVRTTFIASHLTIEATRPLFDAFRRYGAQGNALANTYDAEKKPFRTVSVGLSYDPGNWFLLSELSHLKTNTFIGTKTSMYTSVGWRLASWTPYLSYAAMRANTGTSDPGLTVSGDATASYLNASLNALLLSTPQQKTVSAGVRWDLLRNTALKVQYDRVMPQAGSPGTLVNVQAGFHDGGAISVFSAVVDFVY